MPNSSSSAKRLHRWIGPSLALGVLALLLGTGLAAPGSAAASNDLRTEPSGPILSGSTYEDTIGTENDVDWWIFYTGATTQLDVSLLGLGPDDCFGPVAGLFDANGSPLAHTSYANRNETEHIRYTVGAGTFYVEIEGYHLNTCAGPEALYHLWITASPALLTGPPSVPPPAPPSSGSGSHGTGRGSYAAACRRAKQRISVLSSRLRSATNRRQRNQLRAKLRRSRSEASTYC